MRPRILRQKTLVPSPRVVKNWSLPVTCSVLTRAPAMSARNPSAPMSIQKRRTRTSSSCRASTSGWSIGSIHGSVGLAKPKLSAGWLQKKLRMNWPLRRPYP